MYENWYKLKDKPFQISADPKFLWLGPKHKEALATLKNGVLDAKGFLLLSGDVGTGKTTLIQSLVQSLGDAVRCAVVPDPRLDQMDFFSHLATAFELQRKFNSKGAFLEVFGAFLHQVQEQGQKVLLVIDEAQALALDLLEEIRLLSELGKHRSKLISIFFVGQNEFKKTLRDESTVALKQRIAISYDLEPFTLEETASYVNHRLKVAGKSEPIFKQDAIKEIFGFAQGYPRLTNIICDQVLLTGFVKEMQTIGAKTVRECTIELIMAFPSESGAIELIPSDQTVSSEPTEKSRQTTVTDKLEDARQTHQKEGQILVGEKAPIPHARRDGHNQKPWAANQKQALKKTPKPLPPATPQKPSSKNKQSSVKNIQIVYSRGKKVSATPKAAAPETTPPVTRKQDTSEFENEDLAQQVLKDLRTVAGKNFREALDGLNLARSSPIRMGLNRIYRNISNIEDTINEINQTVEQIVAKESMPKLKDLKNKGPAPFLVNLLDILWHEVARRYMKQRTREAASDLRATENFHITDFPQIILGE